MALTYGVNQTSTPEQTHSFWNGNHLNTDDVLFTPTEYNINPTGFQQTAPGQVGVNQGFNQNQMALANSLQAQVAGTAPSVAQAQLQQGTDANIAQQRALAASGRGTNLGLAQKLAATNAAGAQQTAAGQAAIAKLQEQQTAQQLLSGVNTAGMANDVATAGVGVTQRGQDITQNTANQQAAIQAQQLAQQGVEQQNQQQLQWAQTLRGQQGGGGTAGAIGGIIGGIGSLFSDENLKEDIKPADDKIKSFLDKINAKEYEYKDKADGDGKFISPMAQDLEKSDVGDSMVTDTPHGKMVNYGRALGVMLAGQGYLNDRLDDIEKAMKIKRKAVTNG